MTAHKLDAKKPFRAQRYPRVRAIVEPDCRMPGSLADMVGERILAQIINGALPAGARLKSTELAKELNVSRTPVAKALAKLTADGILSQPNNQRAVVSHGAADWLLGLHELRQLLEPKAAERSCGRVEQEALDDLWALSRDARPTGSGGWTEAAEYFDFALHLCVAEFCDNLPMTVSIRKCWDYKRLSYAMADGCRSTMGKEHAEHVQILAALAANKPNAARDAMAKHLRDASRDRVADQVV